MSEQAAICSTTRRTSNKQPASSDDGFCRRDFYVL